MSRVFRGSGVHFFWFRDHEYTPSLTLQAGCIDLADAAKKNSITIITRSHFSENRLYVQPSQRKLEKTQNVCVLVVVMTPLFFTHHQPLLHPPRRSKSIGAAATAEMGETAATAAPASCFAGTTRPPKPRRIWACFRAQPCTCHPRETLPGSSECTPAAARPSL